MTLGQNIAAARKRNNMSQEDLANSLDVSRQSISLWETDQTIPTLDKLETICNLFNVTMDSLMGRTLLQEINYRAMHSDGYEERKKNHSLDKTSFIFALISLITWVTGFFGLITTLIGIILAICSLKNKQSRYSPYTLAFCIVFFFASIIAMTSNYIKLF